MADDYVTDGLINPGENPPHPTCVETTSYATRTAGMRTWVHGRDCPRPAATDDRLHDKGCTGAFGLPCSCWPGDPALSDARPAGPDPDRDARIDAYRDRERRRAARALDRYFETQIGRDVQDSATAVAGERFVEQVGDYVLARLQVPMEASDLGGVVYLDYEGRSSDPVHLNPPDNCLHQKAHYGVPGMPDGAPERAREIAETMPTVGEWPAGRCPDPVRCSDPTACPTHYGAPGCDCPFPEKVSETCPVHGRPE